MNAEEIMNRQDFQKCLDFHGHLCPGLSIGYKAARAGMQQLKQGRAEDEELVAVVETDACCADAVQVLTGCTFGKGNLFFRDHGKMVFTFASRDSGQGVRVSLKPGAFAPDAQHMALLQKVMFGRADESERQRFSEIHQQRSKEVLAMDENSLFTIAPVRIDLPEKARIDESVACHKCKETTMAAKMITQNGRRYCRDCMKEPA